MTIFVFKKRMHRISCLLCVFLVVTLSVLHACVGQSDVNRTLQNDTTYEEQISGAKAEKPSTCWPIKPNVTQYSVVLDGLKYPKSVLLHQNSSIDFECLNRRKKEKVIFIKTPFYRDEGFYYGLENSSAFDKMLCPVNRCILTNDMARIDEADIFLISIVDHMLQMEVRRKPSDRYVFMLYESERHTSKMHRYNDLFNFTSTFKQDSDFPGFYETFSKMVWKWNPAFDESHDFSEDKTGMAATMVSNCRPSNSRLELVQSLQRFMQVDVFGRCGMACPTENPKDCREYVGKNYKFYLAFENSNCEDYITEKFFEILRYNIIPVVYGGGTYEDYIPKSGFINALDFATPYDLAEYMTYLDQNSTAYNAYFSWKRHVIFSANASADASPVCDICVHLLLEDYLGVTQKTVGDIGTYWNSETNCDQIIEFDQKDY